MIIKKSPQKIAYGLALIFCFISILLIYAVFDREHYTSLDLSTFLYLSGKSAGVIGFLFLSILIFSGDTARFFDGFLGMDRIIKFQRKFSYITLLFILLHPIFFMIDSKSVLPFLIPDFSVIPLALGTISLYLYCIIIISSKFYKRISYNAWQYIHILSYLLFGFSIYHASQISSDLHHIAVQALFVISTIMILVGIIYRARHKIMKRFSPKFYVKEIKKEAGNTFTLVLKSDKIFSYEAGQFCFLQLRKNKLHARHPFTVANAPNKNELRFTVKMTGNFTKALSELKTDDEVIVEGPFGVFTVNELEKNLVFIAGGVGITPFMSIIEDKLQKNNSQKITLLYSSKTVGDIILKDRLDAIKADWFKKAYVITNENIDPNMESFESGRINLAVIKKYVENVENSLFYICGPESMKNNVEIILHNLGVKKDMIIVEDFFW